MHATRPEKMLLYCHEGYSGKSVEHMDIMAADFGVAQEYRVPDYLVDSLFSICHW